MLVLGRLRTKQEVGTGGCEEIDDSNVVVVARELVGVALDVVADAFVVVPAIDEFANIDDGSPPDDDII